jgi:microcystin-dependent protein
MSSQFVAEIRMFGFNFPPTGWAFCNGQLMPISQNTALFSLLGTTYGGDGKSTFALPDMQGNAPMHPGQGQGLSLYDLGQIGGSETVTLLQTEMPIHNHNFVVTTNAGTVNDATNNQLARGASGNPVSGLSQARIYSAPANAPNQPMAPQALAPAGGSLPHQNMAPYLTLNFCIALQGIFPARP